MQRPYFLLFKIYVFLCAIFLAQSYALAEQCQDEARAAGLEPHKALYDISLTGTKSGSQLLNIDGQMFYEWYSTCDAWISTHRFDVLYDYADSPSLRVKSDFSTYESLNGSEMNFTSRRKRQGQPAQEWRGVAKLGSNEPGVVKYSVPEGEKQDIPIGALFPMNHTLGLLEAIEKGQKFYNATIFDGSDDRGASNINAFIGKPVTKITDYTKNAAISSALLPMPARAVQLAFFPVNDQAETADYEMDIIFHENGVISAMDVKYENFMLSQRLVALEKTSDKNSILEKP